MKNNKPETRRYDVTIGEAAKWLGTILITHDGILSIRSEYGSYSYWWTSTGESDFRKFLLDCDNGYLIGKFSPSEEYDGEGTEKSVLAWINSSFQSGELPETDAEVFTEEAHAADFTSEFGMHQWIFATKMPNPHERVVRRTDPRTVLFFERVWPAFRMMLHVEMLKEEKLRVAFPDQLIATIQVIEDSPEEMADALRHIATIIESQGTMESNIDEHHAAVHVRPWSRNGGEFPIEPGKYWAVGFSEGDPGDQFAFFASKEYADRVADKKPLFDEDDAVSGDLSVTRARVVGTFWNSYDPDPEESHSKPNVNT